MLYNVSRFPSFSWPKNTALYEYIPLHVDGHSLRLHLAIGNVTTMNKVCQYLPKSLLSLPLGTFPGPTSSITDHTHLFVYVATSCCFSFAVLALLGYLPDLPLQY